MSKDGASEDTKQALRYYNKKFMKERFDMKKKITVLIEVRRVTD